MSAGASTSIGWCWLPRVASVAWSRGGGGGGGGVGVALLVVGGAGVGVVLAGGLGVPVGRVGVACVRCAVLAVLDWLWVGGGRMGVQVGLWSVCNGWLLVDGARWYGVWVGGRLVVVGRSMAFSHPMVCRPMITRVVIKKMPYDCCRSLECLKGIFLHGDILSSGLQAGNEEFDQMSGSRPLPFPLPLVRPLYFPFLRRPAD